MTTADRIRAMLVKDYRLDAGKLTLDATLEDLGIDSIGIAELSFNLEDEFGLKLPDIPMRLTTFGDVVRYIDGAVAEQGAGAGSPPTVVGRTQPAP